MHPSIPRAPARLHRPARRSFRRDDEGSKAIIGASGITLTGLLAWFFGGSIMMAMPGFVGAMGVLAAFGALILAGAKFWPK